MKRIYGKSYIIYSHQFQNKKLPNINTKHYNQHILLQPTHITTTNTYHYNQHTPLQPKHITITNTQHYD